MDIASPSNAICYCVNNQGFDWVAFGISMVGNLIAGIVTGYLVSEWFKKRDIMEKYPEKCIDIVGLAMNLSLLIDSSLMEDVSSKYKDLVEKIQEINRQIVLPKNKYIEDATVIEFVKKIRTKIVEASGATKELEMKLRSKEKKDSFYNFQNNKKYIEDIIEKNKNILKSSSKEMFQVACELKEHIENHYKR